MESEASLPCSQELTTGHYSEPVESYPNPHTQFYKIHLLPCLPTALIPSNVEIQYLSLVLCIPFCVLVRSSTVLPEAFRKFLSPQGKC
jgi:hypothetical protein